MIRTSALQSGFVGLAIGFSAAALSPAHAAPRVNFQGNTLTVSVPAKDLTAEIDKSVSKSLTGYVINSKTQTAYIKNFRSRFTNGGIAIRFDYNVKRRGSTKTPFGTGYTSWVKDSGWIEVTVKTGIKNWVLYSYTRNGYVKWKSNNWFTNQFKNLFDQKIRDSVSTAVNDGLASATGGRQLNLKTLAVNHGAPVIAKQSGRSTQDVARSMAGALNRTQVNASIQTSGLVVTLTLPKNLMSAGQGEKIRYTIYNASGKTVRVKMSPSGNVFTFKAGETRSFTSSKVDGKAPSMYVYATGRTYRLTSGKHKLWWMSKQNRIGFDRNYQ